MQHLCLFLDPHTNDSELEVQRIIHLQNVANRLPDAFIDTKRVTKSHISAENVPAHLEVPEVSLTQTKASESQIRRKRGRPLGSKDVNPRKRKEHIVSINHDANVTTSNVSEDKIPEVILSEDPKRNEQDLDDSYEMSINYAHNSLGWYRKEIKMNDIFAHSVAVEIMDEDDNDPQTMEECQHRNDWKSWKKAIQGELDLINKREVFGPIIATPKGVKPVGYKWVFVRKRNEQNEVVRYKVRLVAQGFTQKPGIDYTETYSPVVDATTLSFLINLSVIEQLKMQFMDVVTAYLYGSLDTDIYIRIPEGLKVPEALKSKPRHMYSIKLKRSLYGLKQSGPVYVDDLKIIGSLEEIRQAADYLKNAGYLSDPHKAISQSGYVFMYGGTAISWRSTKQTLVATSSNHAELIALYEAGRECVWLRSLIHYVCESCGLEPIEKSPTVIYEDNTACIAQIKDSPDSLFLPFLPLQSAKCVVVHLYNSVNSFSDARLEDLRTQILHFCRVLSQLSQINALLALLLPNPLCLWANKQKLAEDFQDSGQCSVETDGEVDKINLKFAEAREEIESALEFEETVYLNEVECLTFGCGRSS
ncbi:UNVERIFIED_CONTAM: Retrovirus-related Pol polyprotein from transposon RE1 [Sesamum angustifolium]|uniref:Retrovirus-related Pol polyprotein from transposon RE1 n=1 Tax=Sesamum angustifolium TaxID=2727405 RepID=A0AAW2IQ89_9LAMI